MTADTAASASKRQLLRVGVALMLSARHGCGTIIVWRDVREWALSVFWNAAGERRSAPVAGLSGIRPGEASGKKPGLR